jgi:hypothetical protein
VTKMPATLPTTELIREMASLPPACLVNTTLVEMVVGIDVQICSCSEQMVMTASVSTSVSHLVVKQLHAACAAVAC